MCLVLIWGEKSRGFNTPHDCSALRCIFTTATEGANLQGSTLCRLCDTDATSRFHCTIPRMVKDAPCALSWGRTDTNIHLQNSELLSKPEEKLRETVRLLALEKARCRTVLLQSSGTLFSVRRDPGGHPLMFMCLLCTCSTWYTCAGQMAWVHAANPTPWAECAWAGTLWHLCREPWAPYMCSPEFPSIALSLMMW